MSSYDLMVGDEPDKGAMLRFMHLEKLSLIFQVGRLYSALIFSILHHPRSFLVYRL